ncbi:hypothetical protein BLOT_008470 [Blomia tropicalis]|nr:hypothetical protein BLOT_008470 [Blomia tropicalis]
MISFCRGRGRGGYRQSWRQGKKVKGMENQQPPTTKQAPSVSKKTLNRGTEGEKCPNEVATDEELMELLDSLVQHVCEQS